MKIHLTVTGFILTLFMFIQSSAFATMAVIEEEYVRFDDFIVIVEHTLSAESANGLRKQFKDVPYVDFREAVYNASNFHEKQFSGKYTLQSLYEALRGDDVPIKGQTVADLNELIKETGLYELVRRRHLNKVESGNFSTLKQAFEILKCEIDSARTSNGASIKSISYTAQCEAGLKKFNRAMLEEFYPLECPKLPKKEFLSVSEFFFNDSLKPYLENNEIEKIQQFLQALNDKKVVYGFRSFARDNSGCYVLDYSLETNTDASVAGGIFIVAAKKPYKDGICRGNSSSNPVTYRMRVR